MKLAVKNGHGATRTSKLQSPSGRSYCYPHQVVSDPTLTLAEQRSILAAWASDANAVESMPALRHLPGTPFPVTFSSIMDARLQLDALAETRLTLDRKTRTAGRPRAYRSAYRATLHEPSFAPA
jgi:hypothetical protein